MPAAVAALGPAAAGLAPRIAPLLTGPSAARRAAAGELLAALAPDHPGLIPALRDLIADIDEPADYGEPRARAYGAAAALGDRAVPLLPAVLATLEEDQYGDRDLNPYAAEVIAAVGPTAADAAPVLARHLDGVWGMEAEIALLAIGPAAAPAAAPAVAAAARGEWPDPPPERERQGARELALVLLGEFGPAAAADAVPALLAAADDPDPHVRAAAAEALRAFPGSFAATRPALARLAADEFAVVRLPAAVTVRTLAPADPLLGVLKEDPNPAVRAAAE